ncbi:hypothetical protein DFH06DRAFT_1237589 [Mycena polygramma]|nr:hypothetical protein DFH06DRAFT_1237589 [Mycena polygramma]
MTGTIFAVQELVAQFINFVPDSASDLKACALVSWSWRDAAQARLFRKIAFFLQSPSELDPGVIRWKRLQETLEVSPHLIRYIRRLQLFTTLRTGQQDSVLLQICNFPFTHLAEVATVYVGKTLPIPRVLAFQQLLSLPTVRELKLKFLPRNPPVDPQALGKILERCSPALRILDLCLSLPMASAPSHAHSGAARIALTSLKIHNRGHAIDQRLGSLLHPVTLSNLKALWIAAPSQPIHWPELIPLVNAIEILRIDLSSNHLSLELSALPKLDVFCIDIDSWGNLDIERERMLQLLPIMRAASSIRTLIVSGHYIPRGLCEIFDEMLSTPPTIRIMSADPFEEVAAYFPRLSRTDTLSIMPYNCSWWEDMVREL